ncbi:MAG: hypothetical protein KGJ23_12675 [Euryarchaeota archaeon]|nr:hypothetical protein [Euryarchaeota archaeon]MDE1837453.1 hypothetical protein [Euryarchaeota archaeon]MDE1881874.1 hypothetical protein [Euryarchaeota archaeon]MDE2045581.1 hypothetical protein [Thermoplasmata archaeon]
MDPLTELEFGFLLIPLVGFAYGAIEAWLSGREPRAEVVAVDDPAFGGMPTMVSDRWGLTGRPDELRRLPDGAIIPVEIKSCRSPRWGVPYPSHRMQLLAYCALVEETYGKAPPYGILSYGDGRELHVDWDEVSRSDLRRSLESHSRNGLIHGGRLALMP